MLEKITEEEIQLIECLNNPVSATECIFSDLDNLLLDDEDKMAEVRLAQYPMLSFEYMLDDNNPDLSTKENFKIREGAGSIDCFGGRKFGKSLIVEIIDILISMVNLDGEEVGFSSIDAIHIRGILEKVILVLENKAFFKLWNCKINRSPNYRIVANNGYSLVGINMNVASKQPGQQFFGYHLKRLYIEEASFETEEVYKKRIDAISEFGCVIRAAGMTNFTKYSPTGQRFYDLKNRARVCNLPQYSNPQWDEKEKEKAIVHHGGENSISYRIFVKGEIVEDGISVFDMERIRRNYLEDKIVKKFEITKENFHNFRNILILDKPKGVDDVYVMADIGESAPTEIAIFFKVGDAFKYVYNITVYNLTDKEQPKIFEYIAEILKATCIGIDTTDGTGRAIYRTLNEKYPSENLVWCGFNEKIAIDFEKDENNNIVLKDGKPTYREEYVSEWSVIRLKHLLYEAKLLMPVDYTLDKQLNSVVAMQSGSRMVYSVVGDEDHLFSAFRVFAIAQWIKEFANLKPIVVKKFCKSGV